MATARRKGPSLGSRIVARMDASDRARRRMVSISDAAFEADYGEYDPDADPFAYPVPPMPTQGSPHVRSLGAYSMSEAVTRANQYPDRFGQYKPAFSYDGLGAEPPAKTVADVKRLCGVVMYRVKMLEPAVYAVPQSKPDQLAIRSDFMRLKGRMMTALKKAQDAFVACSKSLTSAECDTPAEDAYDALIVTMRQGGSVDSPLQRGDYDDIVKRVKADGGHVDLTDAPEFGYEPPSFGDNVAGEKSIADLKDLVATWDASMASLGQSAGAFLSTWAQNDPSAAADWSNDWAALQQRYAAARADAQSAINSSSSTLTSILSFGVSSVVGDQAGANPQYLEVLKAVKQATTDVNGGATVTKGDYDDLAQRLTAAQQSVGASVFVQQVVQPTATDTGLSVLQSTQNLDVVGALSGQFHSPILNIIGTMIGMNPGAGKGGNSPTAGDSAQMLVAVAAMAVGGVFVFKLFVAPTVQAALGLSGAIVGGYIGYKTVGAISTGASKLGSSPGAKLLGL